MKTRQLIEILPGIRIEVTRRLKQHAGISMEQITSPVLGTPDRAMLDMKRAQRKGVVYSRLLLDEAVAVAKEKGVKEAARITGVKRWSIKQRQDDLRASAGGAKRKAQGARYTMEQKLACVALAKRLMASTETIGYDRTIRGKYRRVVKPKWPQRKAFVEAGRILKMNGRSVEFMWVRGMLAPSTPPLASPPAQP